MLLTLPSPITVFANRKLLVICSLSLIPLVVNVAQNYLYSSRGWHNYEIQYSTISWAVRLLLTPFILVLIVRFMNVTRTVHSFLAIHATGVLLFTAANLSVSMLLCLQTSSPDKRLWNLFNTIRHQSLMTNIIIYTIAVLICYLWTYVQEASEKSPTTSNVEIQTSNVEPLTSDTLNIKSGRQTIIVKMADILSIQADGRYTKVVTEDKTTLLSVSMRNVEEMLPRFFVRIHRSTIINSSYIVQTRSLMNGDYTVTLKNGDRFKVSRTYRDALREVIGKF